MHANFSFLPDGTLNGAMTQQDADKAVSLLTDGTYRKIDATHVVHLDKPDLYIDVLHDFFLQPHLYGSRRSWVLGLLLRSQIKIEPRHDAHRRRSFVASTYDTTRSTIRWLTSAFCGSVRWPSNAQ